MTSTPRYTAVLLCGVKTDKAFLAASPQSSSDGSVETSSSRDIEPVPLFYHLLKNALIPLAEELDRILVSARDAEQESRIRRYLQREQDLSTTIPTEIILDEAQYQNKGPASGILTAHSLHPDSHLVLLAVDFPLVERDTLKDLIQGHQAQQGSPVTCFLHPEDSNPEPVMSVWTPFALERLRENALKGKSGPCYTAKQLWREKNDGRGMVEGQGLVRPRNESWVRDTDTPEEWQAIFGALPEPVKI